MHRGPCYRAVLSINLLMGCPAACSFNFFGETYTSVAISEYGFLQFGTNANLYTINTTAMGVAGAVRGLAVLQQPCCTCWHGGPSSWLYLVFISEGWMPNRLFHRGRHSRARATRTRCPPPPFPIHTHTHRHRGLLHILRVSCSSSSCRSASYDCALHVGTIHQCVLVFRLHSCGSVLEVLHQR